MWMYRKDVNVMIGGECLSFRLSFPSEMINRMDSFYRNSFFSRLGFPQRLINKFSHRSMRSQYILVELSMLITNITLFSKLLG